eukprot:3392111-Rhodomonas_salina.1
MRGSGLIRNERGKRDLTGCRVLAHGRSSAVCSEVSNEGTIEYVEPPACRLCLDTVRVKAALHHCCPPLRTCLDSEKYRFREPRLSTKHEDRPSTQVRVNCVENGSLCEQLCPSAEISNASTGVARKAIKDAIF